MLFYTDCNAVKAQLGKCSPLGRCCRRNIHPFISKSQLTYIIECYSPLKLGSPLWSACPAPPPCGVPGCLDPSPSGAVTRAPDAPSRPVSCDAPTAQSSGAWCSHTQRVGAPLSSVVAWTAGWGLDTPGLSRPCWLGRRRVPGAGWGRVDGQKVSSGGWRP